MVRTRKKDYAKEAMQQEQRQTAQSRPADMAGGTDAATHIGKRSRNEMFDRFQHLPCELRLMVWKAAMTPRLVAVNPRPCPKGRDDARDRKNREINLIRGIPALLAVNQEARHVALRHYTWRFIIDIAIEKGQYWNGGDYWDMRGRENRRAHVVMSPDDTLGLFRCKGEREDFVQISRFRVKVANYKKSPWRIHQTTAAPHGQQWFKKVAILGDAIESHLHIVRALNVTLWDLDSILHAASAEARTARSPHTKHKILIASAKMTLGLRELKLVMLNRIHPDHGQKFDILAYELLQGEKGKDWERFLLMLSRPPSGTSIHRTWAQMRRRMG